MNLIKQNFFKIEKYIFYLLVLTIPIERLPERFPVPEMFRDAHFNVLVIGILVAVIYAFCNKEFQSRTKNKVYFYIGLCLIWPIICTIIGVLVFPFWDEQSNEFLRNTGLIQKVAIYFPKIIYNNDILHLKYSFVLIRNAFHDFIIPLLGIPFVFYEMFKGKNKDEILDVLSYAATLFASVSALYSLFEIPWLLTGNEFYADILKFINTCIYDPKFNNWWPPILWPSDQLRSYTYEPSFFGILAVFVLPMLWYRAFKLKKLKTILLLVFFTWMIYLTKSRTAQVIFFGEIFTFIAFTILGRYRFWSRYIIKVLASAMLAFAIFLIAPVIVSFSGVNIKNKDMSINERASQYFEEDVSSIGIEKTRSNMARWGNMVATFSVGVKHPLFGVGAGLQHMYIAENIPAFASDNGEINFWIRRLKKYGFMNTGFPDLNSYSVIFASYGVLGLVLYLIPVFYVGYIIIKRRLLVLEDFGTVCSIVAFCGQLACLLCNHMMYTYPISLAAVLCLLEKSKDPTGKSNQSIENTKTLL